jgi:hypothetical protein
VTAQVGLKRSRKALGAQFRSRARQPRDLTLRDFRGCPVAEPNGSHDVIRVVGNVGSGSARLTKNAIRAACRRARLSPGGPISLRACSQCSVRVLVSPSSTDPLGSQRASPAAGSHRARTLATMSCQMSDEVPSDWPLRS